MAEAGNNKLEFTCSMRHCTNTSRTTSNYFYTFPADDIQRCTAWIERCERPELIDDLAFLGVEEAMRQRYVCSEHFNISSFKNPIDFSEGLTDGALPVCKADEVDSEVVDQIKRQQNALRTAIKRQLETPEQRADRLYKDSMRKRRQRELETHKQREIRKLNDAIRAKIRRSLETDAQRAKRRFVDTVRAAKRRSEETPEKRERRLKADRERIARRRLMKKLQENSTDLIKSEPNDDDDDVDDITEEANVL